MSYSFGISPDPVPVGELGTALAAARDAVPYLSDLNTEAQEQITAAIAAAEALAKTVVPSEDSVVFASVSGHANPGHLPTPQWSNDCIYVSVSLANQPAPVEEPQQQDSQPPESETGTGDSTIGTEEQPPDGGVTAPVAPAPDAPAPAAAVEEPVAPDANAETPAVTDTVQEAPVLATTAG